MNAFTGHVPVMLSEVVALLSPALHAQSEPAARPVIVDCTLGLGGHAEALLRACPEAFLVGLDRDPQAIAAARDRLSPFGNRISIVEANYDELTEVLAMPAGDTLMADPEGRRRVAQATLDFARSLR